MIWPEFCVEYCVQRRSTPAVTVWRPLIFVNDGRMLNVFEALPPKLGLRPRDWNGVMLMRGNHEPYGSCDTSFGEKPAPTRSKLRLASDVEGSMNRDMPAFTLKIRVGV